MCVSRIQRLMTAFMLGLILLLALTGYVGVAVALQVFVISMMILWALSDFCPSIWVLKKFLPPCEWEK